MTLMEGFSSGQVDDHAPL